MSAIQISFEGKQQTIDQQVPQPSSAKKGVPISLPPSCDIDYQQRLLRKGPKPLAFTGREKEGDGLVCIFDEQAGTTVYTAKFDCKCKRMGVFREDKHNGASRSQIASLALDGRAGWATDKSDMILPNGEEGCAVSLFNKSGVIFKSRSRMFTDGAGSKQTQYKWKTVPTHPELPDMGYFYELQDDKKKTIATTQRLDETADGHPLDEDAEFYPLYLTKEAQPLTEMIVATMLMLERLP